MAHAFMRTGHSTFIVPDIPEGFTFPSEEEINPQIALLDDSNRALLLDPAEGVVSNKEDTQAIGFLKNVTDAALSSTSFSCKQAFVNSMTQSPIHCFVYSIFCCMCFGTCAYSRSRPIKLEEAEIIKVEPKYYDIRMDGGVSGGRIVTGTALTAGGGGGGNNSY